MPGSAQDRVRRGPLAALLILLSLILSAGPAAATSSDIRSSARLGASRPGTSTAILLPGTRNSLEDEAPGSGGGTSVPPPRPAIITEYLWARPAALDATASRFALPPPTSSAYHARAPPAA